MKPLFPPAQRRSGSLCRWWRAAILTALAAALAGCLNLKPRERPVRHFVLTPMDPAPVSAAPAAALGFSVGLAPVGVPGYVRGSSLAVRTAANELRYDELWQWAERLEDGIPRVVAVNLGGLLPEIQVRRSAWRREDVACELYLTVDRFEVDETGRGSLVARWRITAPGAGAVLRHGQVTQAREGPPPTTDPAGSVATLSRLLEDLARQLAPEVSAAARGSGN
jgi:uncharacterized lipoprotein YmbA